MFTGIVEELGVVETLERLSDAARLTVRGALVTSDARAGDSIAVNGCCLTVTALGDGGAFTADVMQESLNRTNLGDLGPGGRVNLERAVAAGQRLGGHIVQGHVDGTGTIRSRTPGEHWEVVEVEAPPSVTRYLVEKGSVTVDGVSLTVVEARDDSFTVSLVPETLARTTLGSRAPGERVNLEVDVVAKYLERQVATQVQEQVRRHLATHLEERA